MIFIDKDVDRLLYTPELGLVKIFKKSDPLCVQSAWEKSYMAWYWNLSLSEFFIPKLESRTNQALFLQNLQLHLYGKSCGWWIFISTVVRQNGLRNCPSKLWNNETVKLWSFKITTLWWQQNISFIPKRTLWMSKRFDNWCWSEWDRFYTLATEDLRKCAIYKHWANPINSL